MNKKIWGSVFITLTLMISLIGCNGKTPVLKGSYQSEFVNGYIILMSFQPDDFSFVQYIDNREVDRGTYEELENGVYQVLGGQKSFEIKLEQDNSFELIVKQLNEGKPIKLENINHVPVSFKQQFDDVEEYKSLLE